MVIILLWLVLCFAISAVGVGKKIGYWGVFSLSLIFSPLIGLIFGLISKDNRAEKLASKASVALHRNKYDNAKNLLDQAISIDSRNIIVLFNFACYYSLIESVDESKQMLAKAVEMGYSNFKNIESDSELENLRKSEGYDEFKEAGFKLTQRVEVKESNLDKIKKLNELKESGAISEEEFEQQKKTLLENI